MAGVITPPPARDDFERYSDDIRRAMTLANREAIRHLHPLIDTPHLLIALAREPTGLAGALLRQKGLTPRRVRRLVRRLVPRAWAFRGFVKLPLSESLSAVVSRTVEHPLSENHDSVGTGGMLLAMLRHDPKSVQLLGAAGIGVADLEKELARYLHRFMVEAPGQELILQSVV
jgi:ATP-dependent Clp protease ATP-binding subunit ClpA